MTRKLMLPLFSIFLAGCLSLEAFGSTWMGTALIQSWKDAPFKIGPFRIQPYLYLNEAGYDSNIYGASLNPVEDYTFTAGPGFYIYLPLSRKIVFSVFESPQYVYLLKTKRERTWNNSFQGQMNLLLNKFLFTFGVDSSNIRERFSTEIDTRIRRKLHGIFGSVLWQPSSKISFALGLKKIKQIYDDVLTVRLNREEKLLHLTAYYKISSKTQFFLTYEYIIFNFQSAYSLLDSKSHNISSGFEFSPTSKIRGRINIGYRLFDIIDPGSEDFGGIAGDINLSWKLFKFLTLRAFLVRDTPFSFIYANMYFIENRFGGGPTIYLFKKIRLDYDYYYGTGTYSQKVILSYGQEITRKFDQKMHSVGIYFRIKKNIGIGLHYGEMKKTSNFYEGNFDRRYIWSNLTYDF